jgi:hypothetical protein
VQNTGSVPFVQLIQVVLLEAKVAVLVTSTVPFAVTTNPVGFIPPTLPVKVHVFGATVRLVTVRYTVAEAVPLRPCAAAVTLAVPKLTPEATPLVSSANDNTSGVSLDQATPLVIRLREPSW